MIIVHEGLPNEAFRIAERLKEMYGFSSQLVEEDLTTTFTPITAFDGFISNYWELFKLCNRKFSGKKVLIVTPRDIYFDDKSKDDDWVFGASYIGLTIVSTARMKRFDNQPSNTLIVPKDLYMKRLEILAVHEIGHNVVSGDHFQDASWVNNVTGHRLDLGDHCTDNSCVMYEVVDIKSPPPTEGYMLLGQKKMFDAGLDDLIERLNPRWFCDRCKDAIHVGEGYN